MAIMNIFFEFILNPWFLISVIFWVIVVFFVVLLRNKKGAYNFFFPLLAMFKTQKLNNIIVRLSKKNPKFWRTFWNIGIFVSFGFIIYALFFFFINLINLIYQPSIEQAIVPLIPGVTIGLPVFFYLILPLLFIMTTHEFAHGISASVDGVEIKSTGVLGVGVFYLIGFGAFVEVDERMLRSRIFHRNTRLRIAAAGTFVNGITAGIAFILILSFPTLISPFYVQVPQVYKVLTAEEGGFNEGNLKYGDVIISIKKQGETDLQYVSLDYNRGIDLTAILNNETRIKCAVGDNLTLKVYNPVSDGINEKNVILGPRYDIGIEYKDLNDTALKITYNYTSNLATNIIITKINGTIINKTNGYTLGYLLTGFNLKTLNLSSNSGDSYILDVKVDGVFVGVQSIPFWMHKNDFAKFFTSNWPDFLYKEIVWLFVISFSITIFNMMPLPIFDGDRVIKELINWSIGDDYSTPRKKKERFIFKENEPECELSEYHVEKIDRVRILLDERTSEGETGNIELNPTNYELIDKIGDGFKDTVLINLPEDTAIKENSVFEISYEYLHDNKKKLKSVILNSIRLITLIVIGGNFLLSFIKFGFNLFWL
jgi:membrane-associated protease RseP (regulator of RpoE activity)